MTIDAGESETAPVTVALAADATFASQLAVVIASIARSDPATPYRIFVLHDGYDDALRARVARSAPDLELRWLDARSSVLDGARLPWHLPPATLYRLRLEELLPLDVERVIYLDTDVVVRRSLVDLWSVDIGGALLGAVRDPTLPWAGAPQAIDWKTLGVPPDLPYFNAGVLLVPLDAWRAANVSARALTLLAEHALLHADQCALNVVARGNWLQLHPRWNLQSGHVTPEGSLAWITEPAADLADALRSPAVIHFCHGPWKRPWQPDSEYPNRELWFETLDSTDWAGWRPLPSADVGRTRVAARHIKRAAAALVHGV